MGPVKVRLVWPAKDGHVSIVFLFGSAIAHFTRRFMEWVHDEGFCDTATRDLMAGYYRRLKAGDGRAEGFRQVQLEMLHSTNYNHPYYWAGFIQSGAATSLQGR